MVQCMVIVGVVGRVGWVVGGRVVGWVGVDTNVNIRFGAPWPPVRNTAILQPLDGKHLQHQINYKHVYQQIQKSTDTIKPRDGHITFLS